jgi:hypothetical protein
MYWISAVILGCEWRELVGYWLRYGVFGESWQWQSGSGSGKVAVVVSGWQWLGGSGGGIIGCIVLRRSFWALNGVNWWSID